MPRPAKRPSAAPPASWRSPRVPVTVISFGQKDYTGACTVVLFARVGEDGALHPLEDGDAALLALGGTKPRRSIGRMLLRFALGAVTGLVALVVGIVVLAMVLGD